MVIFIENDFKWFFCDKELYRSLVLKKNVLSDSFLVVYILFVFLDIEELWVLD